MATLYAMTQKGEELQLKGNENHIKYVYNQISKQTPEKVEVYHYMWWVDDNGNKMDAVCNLDRESAIKHYNTIRNKLQKYHEPLYGVEDWLVAKICGITKEMLTTMIVSWYAFHITERQGGCLVFEQKVR